MDAMDVTGPGVAGAGAGAPAAAAGPGPSPLALKLGYAGLLPFVGGALLVWLVRADALPFAAQALSAYAALIISFLGGIHWGLALRQGTPAPALLLWGVTPSLLAWVAVMMPASSGLVLSGVLLLACWAVDRGLYRREGVGAWLTLRFRLSVVAAASCFVAAAGV
jgi:hypothetical protein